MCERNEQFQSVTYVYVKRESLPVNSVIIAATLEAIR